MKYCLSLFALVAAAAAWAGGGIGIKSELVSSGFNDPLFLTSAPGDDRLFVVEQGGLIRIIENGVIRQTPFADLTSVAIAGGERGLLGLAFHPDYENNRTLFCSLTVVTGPTTFSVFIVRMQAAPDGNTVNVNERVDILEIAQPFSNHNGGMLAFGPDGYLYYSSGDGGSANDPLNNGQQTNTLLGKMLRLDVNGVDTYAIPPTNPFVLKGDGLGEIWAYGLRNPWRFSFDRETGDLWIADVGQFDFEEINFQSAASPGGENYGWNVAEGFACRGGDGDCGTMEGFTPPVHQYPRGSVTGGYVYRGNAIPELKGHYFFADFVRSQIWTLTENTVKGTIVVTERTNELVVGEAASTEGISSFGEDNFGELYFMSHNSGEVFKIRRTVSIADVDGNSEANSTDIQLVINGVLGGGVDPNLDLDNDGNLNAVDVQLVINGVLGIL